MRRSSGTKTRKHFVRSRPISGPASAMRILLVGHGRVGRLVESLAGEYRCEIAGIIDGRSDEGPQSKRWDGVDVAIDFSTPAAVAVNVPVLVQRGVNLVVGTTGWQHDEAAVRDAVHRAGVGVVVAPNFSAGVAIF